MNVTIIKIGAKSEDVYLMSILTAAAKAKRNDCTTLRIITYSQYAETAMKAVLRACSQLDMKEHLNAIVTTEKKPWLETDGSEHPTKLSLKAALIIDMEL